MQPLLILASLLRKSLSSATLLGKRFPIDTFSDRIFAAATEPTLALCLEALMRSVGASLAALGDVLALDLVRLTTSADAPRVLQWLRSQSQLAAMLATTKSNRDVEDVIALIQLPDVAAVSSAAVARTGFHVPISVLCETGLTHGSDTKSGNATTFRRQQVLATDGSTLVLPFYAGNAFRGQMRDLLADHFLSSLGIAVDRAQPRVALWFFYALYSGGALEEQSAAMKAIQKELGDNGAIRSDGIRRFRDMFPSLSLLGCALGNRILPGHIQVADLRPVCREWGTGELSIEHMTTWEFLTRHEDHEAHEEHHGMIAKTETLRAGTELSGGIDIDSAIPSIERSALGTGLRLMAERGKLGAQNRAGYGKVRIDYTNAPDGTEYQTFLADRRADILAYMVAIGIILPLEA